MGNLCVTRGQASGRPSPQPSPRGRGSKSGHILRGPGEFCKGLQREREKERPQIRGTGALCKGRSWGCGRGEAETELAAGVLEPGGDVGREAAAHDHVDRGRGIDGYQQRLCAGQQGLGASARREGRRIEIERAAAGEDIEYGGTA